MNWIKNLTIGKKIIGAFVRVVVLFGALMVMQFRTLSHLGAMQDAGAKRAADAISVKNLQSRIDGLYGLAISSCVSHDLARAREALQGWDTEKDIAMARSLANTDEEKKVAETYFAVALKCCRNSPRGTLAHVSTW
jgi:methyl-accepting chemotaxis protein